VRADSKRKARLNIIRDLLGRIDYSGKDESLVLADRSVVFDYDTANLANGQLAK
jgi:hypothetical protein